MIQFKKITCLLSIVFFTGVMIFISCKKEYSCEGCAATQGTNPTQQNHPPVARAGIDQTILLPTNATNLDGSGSTDPDNNIRSYTWTKISGPTTFNIVNPNSTQTQVTGIIEGSYLFELKVTDSSGLSDKDTVQIRVSNGSQTNRPPVANAGPDHVLPTNTANLNGSGSTDPDNNIVSFLWTKISGPSSFTITNGSTVQTLVTNLTEGVYLFELKVTDAGGLFGNDTVKLFVINPPTGVTDCFIPNAMHLTNLSGARSDMSTAICNNKILVAGGWNYNSVAVVDIFDPANNSIISSNLSLARYAIAGVGTANKAFFAGGFTIQGWYAPSSRIDIYNAATNIWSTAELSTARGYMAVGTVGDKVFFAGGMTNPNNVTSRVDIYDLSTGQWTIAELSEARGDLAAAVVGNKILFAGGRSNSGSSNRVDIYDASTNTWSIANLSTPHIGVTSIVLNNKAYFVGGNFGSGQNSIVEVYDLQSNSWSTLQLSEGKVWIPVGTSNNKIAFIGGMLGWFNHSTKIEIYDPATNTFSSSYMNKDLMFESIVSFNNFIYSFGGTIQDGDLLVSSICKFQL